MVFLCSRERERVKQNTKHSNLFGTDKDISVQKERLSSLHVRTVDPLSLSLSLPSRNNGAILFPFMVCGFPLIPSNKTTLFFALLTILIPIIIAHLFSSLRFLHILQHRTTTAIVFVFIEVISSTSSSTLTSTTSTGTPLALLFSICVSLTSALFQVLLLPFACHTPQHTPLTGLQGTR